MLAVSTRSTEHSQKQLNSSQERVLVKLDQNSDVMMLDFSRISISEIQRVQELLGVSGEQSNWRAFTGKLICAIISEESRVGCIANIYDFNVEVLLVGLEADIRYRVMTRVMTMLAFDLELDALLITDWSA